MEALAVAKLCAQIAADKRAQDLLIFEIGKLLGVADYFVCASARNKRQLKAIANGIRVGLKEEGVVSLHAEGQGTERWLLLDYGDVIVHLFDPETRAYYDLESLWADAPRVSLDDIELGRGGEESFEDDFEGGEFGGFEAVGLEDTLQEERPVRALQCNLRALQ